MIILAMYLVIFKGYSVIKFEESESQTNDNKKYGACTAPMGYDYTHNGVWGCGNTAIEAIINAYKNSK